MLLSKKEHLRMAEPMGTIGERKRKDFNPINVTTKKGRWSNWEKEMFLRGLRQFGKGKWKQIQKMIPTRTTIQVKTHAQLVLKRIADGEDIFARNDTKCSSSSTPPPKVSVTKMRKNLLMTPEYEDFEAATILFELQSAK